MAIILNDHETELSKFETSKLISNVEIGLDRKLHKILFFENSFFLLLSKFDE